MRRGGTTLACKLGTQDLNCSFEQFSQRVKILAAQGADSSAALIDIPVFSDHDSLLSALMNDSTAFVHGDWSDIADCLDRPEVAVALDAFNAADMRTGAPAVAVVRGEALISLVPVFPANLPRRKLLVWMSKSGRTPFQWTQLQQVVAASPASRRSFEPLSARELEVTRWISEGKTSVEIGMILDLSEHTVNEYIRSSMAKLNCANRMHLISTSIRLGLLA